MKVGIPPFIIRITSTCGSLMGVLREEISRYGFSKVLKGIKVSVNPAGWGRRTRLVPEELPCREYLTEGFEWKPTVGEGFHLP